MHAHADQGQRNRGAIAPHFSFYSTIVTHKIVFSIYNVYNNRFRIAKITHIQTSAYGSTVT